MGDAVFRALRRVGPSRGFSYPSFTTSSSDIGTERAGPGLRAERAVRISDGKVTAGKGAGDSALTARGPRPIVSNKEEPRRDRAAPYSPSPPPSPRKRGEGGNCWVMSASGTLAACG